MIFAERLTQSRATCPPEPGSSPREPDSSSATSPSDTHTSGLRRTRWLAVCLAAAYAVAFVLLLPHPPFQDLPAHAGAVGVLAWNDRQPELVSSFYQIRGVAVPNGMLYGIATTLATALRPEIAWAVTLAAAVFSVCLGLIVLLDDKPWSGLALGCLLSCSRPAASGFVPNVLALGLAFVALSRVRRIIDEAPTWRDRALMTGLYLLLLWAHVFVFLVVLGWTLCAVAMRPRRVVEILGPPLVAGLAFAPVFGRMASHASTEDKLRAITDALSSPSWARLTQTASEGLFSSLRFSQRDDACQMLLLGLVGLGLMLRLLAARRSRLERSELFLLLCMLSGSLVMSMLAENVGPPFDWWGPHLRIPPMVLGLTFAVVVAQSAAWYRVLLGSAGVATSLVLLLAWYGFETTVATGIDEAVDAIPAGKRVTLLVYGGRELDAFHGEPLGYAGNYYLLRRGGVYHPDLLRESRFAGRQGGRLGGTWVGAGRRVRQDKAPGQHRLRARVRSAE